MPKKLFDFIKWRKKPDYLNNEWENFFQNDRILNNKQPKRRLKNMIKNLQNQLNEAGKIKIGKKGKMTTSAKGNEFRLPVKFDHFEIVTTEKDEQDDYVLDAALMERLSSNGLFNKNNELVGIPVRLIYNDIESNFPHQYVSYVKGKLTCRGDGEISHKRIDNFEKDHKCPCERSVSGYDGKDGICKMTGTLTCVIDEANLFGQAHTFRTTGANSVKGIVGSMSLLLKATNNRLAWLPLMLMLNEKNTTTPQGINTKVYVVSLCFRGNTEALRDKVLKLIGTDKQFLIEAETKAAVPDIDSEDEQEFVNEFFPSQVDKETAIQAEKVEIGDTATLGKKEVEEDPIEGMVEDATQGGGNLSPEHEAQIIEPMGEALAMYKRFLSEETYDKAYSCANRLKKGHLLWWLAYGETNIVYEYKALKPKIMEHVAGYLSKKFKPAETEPQDSPATHNPQWDDSGPAHPDQLRVILQLKKTLEDMKRIKPESWSKHCNFFQDINGGKVESAKDLTINQTYTFINMLEEAVVAKD